MTDELKPCPFCGGEAKVLSGVPDGVFVQHICGWEGFASEMFGYRCSTEAEAIVAWNRRSPDPALVKALEAASHALRSYQHGNASHELAQEIADHCDAILTKARET